MRIGIVGLGKMGLPMALRLLAPDGGTAAPAAVTVCDLDPDRVAAAVAAGARAADHARAVAERSDLVLLSLPDPAAVRAVMLDPECGIAAPDRAPGSLRGVTVVDSSTVTVALARECGAAAARLGGAYLDAPVTGGVSGAARGTLHFFVGADDPDAVSRCAGPLFARLGCRFSHVGPVGHGQAAKAACQMLGSAAYAVAAEALAMLEGLGVDPARVAEAWDGGRGLSAALALRASGEYGAEGYLAQRGKDLDCAAEALAEAGVDAPVTAAVLSLFTAARAAGLGPADPHALCLLWPACGERPDRAKDRGVPLGSGGDALAAPADAIIRR